jgi:hypothetical protein
MRGSLRRCRRDDKGDCYPTLGAKTKTRRGWGTRHPGSGLGWGIQLSHPRRKNKNAPRVGHPAVGWWDVRTILPAQ